jgi:halocarboxylic acid dehydrogenase DehI
LLHTESVKECADNVVTLRRIIMFRLGRPPRPVAEHEARGNIERVYHEIKHTLRVTGIDLIFHTWAGYGVFLPAMWDAMRANAETCVFEHAADCVRAEAVHAAQALGRLDATSDISLGESQAYHIQGALKLYHYINPKLLVLTSAVQLALHNETLGRPDRAEVQVDLIQRGPPTNMHPLDMVSGKPDDKHLRALFKDIKTTLDLSAISSEYRTLALWPHYLDAAWTKLRPIVQCQAYDRAADALRHTAQAQARALPYPVLLSHQQVEELGVDADEVTKITEQFERLLSALILNVVLLALDWYTPDEIEHSPFPAATRCL